MTILIAVDTETTGLAKTVGSEDFVQLSAIMHREGDTNIAVFNEYAIPRVSISEGAARTHGMTLERLAELGARGSSAVALDFANELDKFCNGEPYVLAMHNSKHDEMILKGHPALAGVLKDAKGVACTRRAAEREFPLLENHQLGTVAETLRIFPEGATHDGLTDAKLCFHIARRFAKMKGGYDALAEWLSKPVLLEVMPFSRKYKGERFEDIDDGFLKWCVEIEDMNEDVKFTAKHHLKLRKVAQEAVDFEEGIPF